MMNTMDLSSAPPTNAAAPTTSTVGTPPQLGTPVPGTTGGLPAQGGLSVLSNPMATQLHSRMQSATPNTQGQSSPYPAAPQPGTSNPQNQSSPYQAAGQQPQQTAQQMQQYGRGEDTMLVHMTPNEVNSLQGLAMAHGGSLTINPHTGLPEAGWLGKLLPTILGIAGAAFGLPTWAIGLGVGAGQTALTGDLGKGLTTGLQAFGGAGLGQAAGIGGKLGSLGQNLGISNSATGAAQVAGAPSNAFTSAFKEYGAKSPGLLSQFGAETSLGAKGIVGKALPALAGSSVLGAVSNAATPGYKTATGQIDNSYQGPYYSPQRHATFAPSTEDLLSSSKERRYFDVDMPEVYNAQGQLVQPGSSTARGTPILQSVLNPSPKKGQPMYSFNTTPWMGADPEEAKRREALLSQYGGGYAEGGQVHMREGSFVMPARETAEFGKGSTDAGQRVLAGLGGLPIRGKGDGVSDDIPARIGKQEARVADGEVHFPPEAVTRLGGGNHQRGTQKLYAMMKRAEQSRKKAARGGAGLELLKGVA